MSSPTESSKIASPMMGQAETMVFLKQHLPIKEIMTVTRGRFAEIDNLLLELQINRHDQSHQVRTAVHATQAMRQLGFSHREVMQATTGALIHDVGYNQPDEAEDDCMDGYNIGTKAKFKKHALKGAQEVKRDLQMLLQTTKEQGDVNPVLQKLTHYKDENGETQIIDESDIEAIVEAILNHNDYGKDNLAYDPRQVGKGALMVQLFDKLDICHKRVYKEHMDPEAFVEESKEFDKKYFHRVVPFCIQNYEPKIDAETGTMEMTYHVDLTKFRALMRQNYPNSKYSEADFVRDFEQAYSMNCRIAAEAISVIFDKPTDQGTLTVSLNFADGKTETLEFSRPNREIYKKEAQTLRVSIGELMKNKGQAA